MFENKKIFILGMARSGYEAAKFLSQYNNEIVLNDGNEKQDEKHIKELEELGVKVVLGKHPDELLTDDFDYIIKNPGIKDTHKYIEYAYKHNIKVINEMELAYYFLSKKDIKLVSITGTNGKTTTTTLIYEIIKRSKRKVHLTGNIGYPLISFLNDISDGDIVVSEVSIQQLVNLDKFKPDIAVITNISEAHIDHVGSFENYIKTKAKIFRNQTKDDYAIINMENNYCMDITKDINSNKMYFSSKNVADIYINNNSIYYKNNKYLELDEIGLIGMHNYENIMCAILACKIIGVEDKYIKEVIRTFNGVEHRLEYVCSKNKRKFYNDSKATNNKSTMIALSSFKSSTILIMGGLDRGQSFDELYPYMKNVKLVVAYGQTKNKIKDFCNKYNIKCNVFDNLLESTHNAYDNSIEGDIILLSPACASWDQYKKFEDRGLEFKKIVNDIN